MFMAMLMLASCANQTSGNEASIEEEAVVPSLSEDISDVVSIVDVRPIDESVLFAGVSKLLNAGQGNLFILDSRGAIISLNGDGQQGPLKLTRGRASNEYVSASDICYIDGKLCVLENARIKVFDIYDTHKNFQIDLTGLDDPADALAVVPGDRFYLFSAFSMSSRSDKKGRGYTLRMIDRDGHLISESIPREDCTFSMNNISQSGDNTYYLRPQNSESIFYRLEKDGPVPAFKVDFGDKAMPARYFYDAAGEDIGAYMLLITTNCPWIIMRRETTSTSDSVDPRQASVQWYTAEKAKSALHGRTPGRTVLSESWVLTRTVLSSFRQTVTGITGRLDGLSNLLLKRSAQTVRAQ